MDMPINVTIQAPTSDQDFWGKRGATECELRLTLSLLRSKDQKTTKLFDSFDDLCATWLPNGWGTDCFVYFDQCARATGIRYIDLAFEQGTESVVPSMQVAFESTYNDVDEEHEGGSYHIQALILGLKLFAVKDTDAENALENQLDTVAAESEVSSQDAEAFDRFLRVMGVRWG